MAATALLRLGALTGRQELRDLGAKTLRSFAGLMAEAPAAAGQMLMALDFSLGPTNEIAVIGKSDGKPVRQVLGAIRRRFLPTAARPHPHRPPPRPPPRRRRASRLPAPPGRWGPCPRPSGRSSPASSRSAGGGPPFAPSNRCDRLPRRAGGL